MTTIIGGTQGSANFFGIYELAALAGSTLGSNSATQFVLSTEDFSLTAQGSGLGYSGGHPSSGTITSLSLLLAGYSSAMTWSSFSLSVASLWQAISTGDAAAFNTLFFDGNDTFTTAVTAVYGGDRFYGYGGDDVFNMANRFGVFTLVDGGEGNDTLNLDGDYSQSRLLSASVAKDVEKFVLAGGHSYNFYTQDNSLVASGKSLTIDGSALLATDTFRFSGSGELDGSFNLIGGAGNDLFRGSSGNDTFNGGGGSDTVDFSGGPALTLDLNLTTPQNFGYMGSDTLIGIENIIGTMNADHLVGNASDNTFRPSSGDDYIDGGAGNDTVDYSDGNGVTIDLNSTAPQYVNGLGSHTLISIENVIGSSTNDTFIGTPGDNVFDGGFNLDTVLLGNAIGAVTLDFSGGGSGPVVTGAGLGHDTYISIEKFVGTASDDTVIAGPGFFTFDGGAGFDTVDFSHQAVGVSYATGSTYIGAGSQSYTSVEKVIGTAYDDHISGSQAIYAEVYGGDGNDELYSSALTSKLYGGAGNDVIGSSHLDTGDQVDGGSGIDTLKYFGSSSSSTAFAANAFVNIEIFLMSSGSYTYFKFDDANVAAGATLTVKYDSIPPSYYYVQPAWIDASAESNSNYDITTTWGDDRLVGGAGDDTFASGGGVDTIIGGGGIDTAVFTGSRSDYAINVVAGVVTLVDHRSGTPQLLDGTDTVSGVEFFKFADGTIAAGLLGNALPTGAAVLGGNAIEDQTLTASTATLADGDGLGTLHYQWQRDTGRGFTNVGTGQATYLLGDDDVGIPVRVVVSYVDGHGNYESVTSADSAAVVNVNDAPTGALSLLGVSRVGQALVVQTQTLADADGLGTLHYQWQRDAGFGFVNFGADNVTYTPIAAEIDAVFRVVVSYTDQRGTAEHVTTAVTDPVIAANYAPTGTAAIVGTATEDQVLTASTATLDDIDGLGALHYQWQRDAGSGFVNAGADQATYTLGDADVGTKLRVVVKYTDGHGTAEVVPSAATATVANVNDAPQLGGAGNTVGYTEQASPRVLDSALTVADVDSATLAGASVTITAGYVAGDTLNVSNQNGIAGSYNAATHVLTLSGASSVANYQAALRAVTFSSASDNPTDYGTSASRTISWKVDDGQGANHASNIAATTLNVTAVNDAPSLHNDAFAVSEQAVLGEGRNLFADNGAGADSDPDTVLSIVTVNGAAGNVGHQIALASGALLTVNANGTFTYDTNHAFDALSAPGSGAGDTSATDSFTFGVAGGTETVTVTITGADFDDTLYSTSANDDFDGGIGTDALVFTGNRANYAITFDGATGAYTIVDQRAGHPDGTDTARNFESFRFADGTIDASVWTTFVNNPDGSSVTTFQDASANRPWASKAVAFDNTGSVLSQTIVVDNGGKWVNTYDPLDTSAVLWKSAAFDATGHQLSESGTNDNGTHWLTLNDVAGAWRWTTATISFDANWNQTGIAGTNDDGSHTIAFKDVAAAYDTLPWFAAPYDADFGGTPVFQAGLGGAHADYIVTFAGNDALLGDGGDDILIGNGGNDLYNGGSGADRFVFHNGDGLDVIQDFQPAGPGNDVIELHGYDATNYTALQALMTQVAADVVIAFDPMNTITLQHVTLAQLSAGDFAFG